MVQRKCEERHGRAGDSHTLPGALQHLATTLGGTFPPNSISRGISADNGERALIYSQMLKLSSARLFIAVIYSPRLKWPFAGMEWFPLPLVPYVIIFFKNHCIDLVHTIHLVLQLLSLPTKEKKAWRQNRNFHFKSSGPVL